MRTLAKSFIQADSGATAIEYGLIVALIAVFIIGAVSAVGGALSSQFTSVASSL
jgi:pilus assembly protein Flp/PilA